MARAALWQRCGSPRAAWLEPTNVVTNTNTTTTTTTMNNWMSLGLSIAVAMAYVVSIYSFRPPEIIGKDRDDLAVIYHRFKSVTIMCGMVMMIIPMIMEGDFIENFKAFRLFPHQIDAWIGCWRVFITMSVLYMGPIWLYIKDTWDVKQWKHDGMYNFTTVYGIRDHIFAPITEEFIYRAVIFHILEVRFAAKSIILWSPLLFGIAHIHHGYHLIREKNLSMAMVVMNGVFQTVYTSLFGVLANYVLYKYDNVWCCVVIHSYCNVMGFPEMRWDYGYMGMIVGGIVGFYKYI